MSLIIDILAGAFAQALDGAIVLGLEKVYEDEGQVYYEALVRGSYPSVNGFLRIIAGKTKTKIDDKGVDAISDAIRTSAATHGIDLDAKPSDEVVALMATLPV